MDRRDKLIRSGLALATELDLPVVLQRIVELAVELTNATYGALGVLGSNGSIDEFITVGVTDQERAAIGDPPVGHGILGLLIRETTPVRIPRIGDHPDSYGFPPNHPPMTSRRRRQDEQRDRRRARPGGEDREELRFEHPVQARGRATGRSRCLPGPPHHHPGHPRLMTPAPGAVDLLWIPLGAGGHVVRLNGKVYEAIRAFIEHRPRCALFHSALEVSVPDGQFVIESAPIPDRRGQERGVVAEGPVGTRWSGRFRLFRYEIRRWRGGSIPDAGDAVSSPVRVANDLARAQRVLDLVPSVPTPVWGRDELHTGDMWNSNSLISWLLARAGVETEQIQPPAGGRAPGWDAGLVVAQRGGAPLRGAKR